MYKAIIVRLKEIRIHPNADRLKLTTIEGNQVIVGLDAKEGDLGIYFPTDGALSDAFAKANDLIRRKNSDGTPAGGMFDENKRVRTQKLRGEISDGFYCPIEFLSFIKGFSRDKDELDHFHIKGTVFKEGDELDSIGDVPLCTKYTSPRTKQQLANVSGRKNFSIRTKMFHQHFETSHFGRCVNLIPDNSHIIITEKVHGTSQRVGHVQVQNKNGNLWDRICLFLMTLKWKKEIIYSDWEYMVGTRRVVLDLKHKKDSGFHSDSLRELAAKPFMGKLHKGETVFYEVVGYESSGKLIMPSVDIKKLNDKEFEKKYSYTYTRPTPISPETVCKGYDMKYTYGCKEGEFKIFVYRITMTNEDGYSIDYSWNDVKKRCDEMEVAYCPEIHSAIWSRGIDITEFVETLAKGESLLDSSHIREGVCVRVEGGLSPKIYKHKSFEFKVLEGIVKDTGVVDLEEAN